MAQIGFQGSQVDFRLNPPIHSLQFNSIRSPVYDPHGTYSNLTLGISRIYLNHAYNDYFVPVPPGAEYDINNIVLVSGPHLRPGGQRYIAFMPVRQTPDGVVHAVEGAKMATAVEVILSAEELEAVKATEEGKAWEAFRMTVQPTDLVQQKQSEFGKMLKAQTAGQP